MSDPVPFDPLGPALARLSQALDLLEAAAQRHLSAETSRGDLAAELMLMREDRQRLADLLDTAVARGRHLENTCDEVTERIDRVVATIRDVIAENA